MVLLERSLDTIDRSKWEELTGEAENCTPFVNWEWLELVRRGIPAWDVHCIVAEEGSRYVAGLPVVVIRMPGVIQGHSLAFGWPAGPVRARGVPPSVAEELVDWWLDRHLARWPARRFAMTLDDAAADTVEFLRRRGFEIETQTAFRVPLAGRSFHDWERSLPQQTRNKNRQAQARGGTFEAVTSPDAAEEIARLAQDTAQRHGNLRIQFGAEFYRNLLQRGESRMVRVVMVRVDGRPAAFNLCVVYGGRMWLIDHGADTSLLPARPNNLIYRSIIRDAFREGLEEVDLGVVPEGNRSLERFKRGLGGLPHHRACAIRTNALFRASYRVGELAPMRRWRGA